MEKCYYFSLSVNILLSCLPSHLVWLRGGLRKKYWAGGAQRLDKGQWGGQRAGSCDAGLTADTELVVLPHPPTSTPGAIGCDQFWFDIQPGVLAPNNLAMAETKLVSVNTAEPQIRQTKKDHIWYMVQWFNTPRQLWMYGGDIAVKCQSHDQVSVCLAWNALLPDKVEISSF